MLYFFKFYKKVGSLIDISPGKASRIKRKP